MGWFRTIFASCIFAWASLATGEAIAREPMVLSASTNWNIDYAEDKCRLIRHFGEGENKVELHFEQATQHPYYNIALFGEPVDSTRGEVMEVAFGPAEGSSERSYFSGDLKGKIPFLLMHGIHLAPVPEDIRQGDFVVVDIGSEREKAIQNLTLSKGLRRPLRLELGPMDEPLAAMRVCVADLIETLKIDDEGLAQVVTGPKPVNEKKMARTMQQTYPTRMLRRGQGGTVSVQLIVNAEGKPTVCQIAQSDRPAAFDDLVCLGLLQTAEFTPAIGPDGEARFGMYSTKVTYRIN